MEKALDILCKFSELVIADIIDIISIVTHHKDQSLLMTTVKRMAEGTLQKMPPTKLEKRLLRHIESKQI